MWKPRSTAMLETTPESEYQRLKEEAHRTLAEAVDPSRLALWPRERVHREVTELCDRLAEDMHVSLSSMNRDRLRTELIDEVFGLGPLEPLMQDPLVTEILANGPDKVYVERNGTLQPTMIRFANESHLMRLVQRIASRVGRRIDESSPMVDARLPDGSRVNAVIRPLASEGPVLSIRRFGKGLSAQKLLNTGSITPTMLQFLTAAVASRTNILISGGGGAGKTTLLNAASEFIGPTERVVTIEDTLELQLRQAHVVRMETRPANLEGQGEITQRQLLRNALRMRPDRIIVGECRGVEAMDMLQAMNTGHDGSLTTVHANDTRDALARLEMMVGMAGVELPVAVMRGYIAGAISLIVHVSRLTGGDRKVTRITELVGYSNKSQKYRMQDLFRFVQTGVSDGRAIGHFEITGKVPRLLKRFSAAGMDLPESDFLPRIESAGWNPEGSN
ncbi:CpaF family protein [Tuwongella immobilis]|uniref:Bacterial type II secretion system protein E domain-containing protein n=1 Tax=Tuwongella immobilis TaxID=692036 RepID=A0A6C2YX40_9BACT|nr:CpaF family protein [Tuwongella immobilis]VIP05703.1 type ii secretion system protein e : Secretion system protein TadA OS=uncultured planctomycete GN=HGMM_F12C05C33 PE=4 SV=1: T2SE [Tuwongella immobilis]VTS08762.1 type ii secretion system protein e : Secretion system protein TadA OS=uncultured planctomycete GN=HGMM_F12C05C33 PE=4 SV=1: T2SE [Tuwongella immobilis]